MNFSGLCPVHNYTIVFLIHPIPSIPHSTTSPGFRNLGGIIPIPTPAGVPMAMMVPGFNVMPADNSAITWGISKMNISVLLFCRSTSLTLLLMASFGGLGTSSSVTINGPMGVNPSRLFPKYHCLWRVCTFLALTSLITV